MELRENPGSDDRRRDALIQGLRPSPPLLGTFRPQGSKSLAQRAVLVAALSEGRTQLDGIPEGADVESALALISDVGARVRRSDSAVSIEGNAPTEVRGWKAESRLRLGESGTLARIATACAALCGAPGANFGLDAAGTLLARTSKPLFEALRGSGASCAHREIEGGWPVDVVTAPSAPTSVILENPISSQEVSALLIALAARAQNARLEVCGEIPSRPYVDMTVALLRRFGASVKLRAAARQHAIAFEIQGPCAAPGAPIAIEPDASSAAVALAAACLTGGELRISGLGSESLQGDVKIVPYLAAFGCDARAEPNALVARGRPRHGASLDLSGEPDLAPVLAMVAAAVALGTPRAGVRTTSVLTGLASLKRKESDRLEGLARALADAGCAVEVGRGSLSIAPPVRSAAERPVLFLDPHGDHRMVFAFALLGLVREDVLVRGADCVDKSWPEFWSDLRRLGAFATGKSSAWRGLRRGK